MVAVMVSYNIRFNIDIRYLSMTMQLLGLSKATTTPPTTNSTLMVGSSYHPCFCRPNFRHFSGQEMIE